MPETKALTLNVASAINVQEIYQEKRVSPEGEDMMVGIVEGYLATWDVDRGGDQFIKGCFDESIGKLKARKRPLRLKRQHDMLIGGFDPEKLRQDETGLWGVAEINLGGEEGRYAYSLARQGVLSDFSVGISAQMSDVRLKGQTRQILKATLWECSLVDEPMNEGAVATMVRGFDIEDGETIDEEKLYQAAARVALDGKPEAEVAKINDYYSRIGHASPFERGVWGIKELAALPMSLRRGIIRKEKLSRDAVDAVVEALHPSKISRTLSSKEQAAAQEVASMFRKKQINEDTAAEIRGLLDAKAEAVQTIRALIGDDDFNEDTSAEVVGLLEADMERTATILSLMGVGADESEGNEEDMGRDEEKAIDAISIILKGAFDE